MAGSATDPPSLVPLKALRYGRRVLRGPDWQYYDDSELTKGMGTVVEPDDSILTEWTLTGCKLKLRRQVQSSIGNAHRRLVGGQVMRSHVGWR